MSDQRLEELADVCIQRLETEGPAAIEAICDEHPDDAVELRRILSNLTRIGLVGGTLPSNEPPRELGDFRLIERLGQGGMGVVYDAEQKSLGRRVALKILRPGAILHRGARERFEREITAISKLDDPGICTVFDAGEVEGVPYLAMRRIEGETLAVKIANRRSEPDTATRGTTTSGGSWTREVVHWVEQIARAIHHAHEAGVVHRDLKPANVMIDPRGQPVVLDFGLARAIEDDADQLTMTGDRVGTPVYMAPEQLDAGFGAVDRRTDVYALGAILYECLALEPPFQAPSRAALFHRILTEPPPSLPKRRFRHVGRELRVILEKALAKEPRHRFTTADELADELRRVRQHEPIRSRRPGALLRLTHWVHRHPVLATALLALVAGLSVSLALLSRVQTSLRKTRARLLASAPAETAGRDNHLALRLALAAVELDATPENVAELQRAFTLPQERLRIDVPPLANDVAISPDGKRLLACSSETVQLWSLDPPRLLPKPAFGRGANSVAFHPEDPDLALLTGGRPRRARLWNLRTGEHTELKHPRAGRGLFLRDGRILTAGAPTKGSAPSPKAKHSICLWSEDGKRLLRRFPQKRPILEIAVAPGGDECAIVHLDGVTVLALPGGAPKTYLPPQPQGRDRHLAVAYSPDGTRIATSGDGMVRVWSRTGKLPLTIPETGFTYSIAFSPDSRWLLTGQGGGVCRVFDLRGREVLTLGGHRSSTWRAVFGPEGRIAASASVDGTVRVWELGNAPAPALHAHDGALNAIDVAPDGRTVATACWDRTARVWEWQSGKCSPPLRHDGRVDGVCLLPNDTVLSLDLSDDTVHARLAQWTHGGKRLHRISLSDPSSTKEIGNMLLEPSRDRTRVLAALGGHGPGPRLFDLDLRTRAKLGSQPRHWATLAPDGQSVLWSWLGHLEHVDLTGQRVPGGFTTDIEGVFLGRLDFSPDGRMAVAGSHGGNAFLWREPGAAPLALRGHEGRVKSARFAPSGDRIITASNDRTARVFDLEGNTVAILKGNRAGVVDARIAKGHAFTASGGVVRVWILDTARLLRLARQRARTLEWTPEELARYGELLGDLVDAR